MKTHPMLVVTNFFGTHVNAANAAVGIRNSDGTLNVSGTVISTAQTAHSWTSFVLTDSGKFVRVLPGFGTGLGFYATIDSGRKIVKDLNSGKSPQQSDIAGAIGGVAAMAGGAALLLASGSVVVPLATVAGVGAGVWQFVASGQGWTLDDALYPIRQTLDEAQKSEVFDALRQLSETKGFNDALSGALGGVGDPVISADTLWSRPDVFEPASEFERSMQGAIDDALKAFKAAGMSADDALQRVAGKLDDYLQILPFGHMGYASLATGGMGPAMSATMASFYSNWKVAESTRSPLILDLDQDGVETLGESAGVYFDHAGDGFAESTGWVGKDDGLLVRDLDGDGRITSGRELFGDHTLLASGKKAVNGFEALKALDGNGDGMKPKVTPSKHAATMAQVAPWHVACYESSLVGMR